MDYRALKDTVPDRYPLPRIDELMNMVGSRVFLSLDIMKGYHQVTMEESSKPKLHSFVIWASTNTGVCLLV